MPSLPVLFHDVVSRVFIESRELEQGVVIYCGMAAEQAGLASEGILPGSHVRWLGENGQQPQLSSDVSGLNPQWPELPMVFQCYWEFGSRQHICQCMWE
ncbi:hypothetical protein TNCV_2134141 [Trichonephila clavipes]|nr:hypothetical protein TNCV_2134141 [Trichonephila clavipes]